MTPKPLIPIAALLAGFCCQAQNPAPGGRFDPLAAGYLDRAAAMYRCDNPGGTIDQIRHLDTQGVLLGDESAEEAAWLLAIASYERGEQDCLRLLSDFTREWPSSAKAPEAAMAIGNWYFFAADWPRALTAYQKVDRDRLSGPLRTLCTYRLALSMIRTGHFAEARAPLARLKNARGYADVYAFYNAYLDYIAGDFKSAYAGFRKVTPSISGLDAGYYMTQIEYSDGRYEDVISHGGTLLSRRPIPELAPELNRIVGLSYFKTGRPDVAQGYLESYLATADGDRNPEAIYALGAIAYGQGHYRECADFMNELTDLETPIGQGAWLYLGQCLEREGDLTAAALAFNRAARMGCDAAVTETARYNHITALTRGGKLPFASSATMLEDFAKRYPNSAYTPEVETYLATAYFNDRNYAKALQTVESMHNPSAEMLALKQKALYELGIADVSNGRPDRAAEYLRQAAAMRGSDRELAAQSSLWLGDAYSGLHCWKEARDAYNAFLRNTVSSTNRALGLYDAAYASFKLQDWNGAEKDFSSALSARPALDPRLKSDARLRLADCFFYTRRYDKAADLYSQAIAEGTAETDYALYRRASIRGLLGNLKGKAADLNAIAESYPESPLMAKAMLDLALLHEEAGRNDLAADAYRRRLAATGQVDTDELLRMARTMHDAGRWEDLLDVTARLRRAGGLEAEEMADTDLQEADAWLNTGQRAKAAEIYNRLATNTNSAAGARSAVTLAEMALTDGHADEARQLMEDFTDAGTPHQYWLARGFITLADAYAALGDRSLARQFILSLRDNYPGDETDIATAISSRLKKWK